MLSVGYHAICVREGSFLNLPRKEHPNARPNTPRSGRFQHDFSREVITRNALLAAQEEARANDLAREGEKVAHQRSERTHARTWDDYMHLADILAEISVVALHRSGANSRRGRAYATVMSRLLARRAPKLGDKKRETLRAALLNIHEHRAAVDAWRADWTDHERQTWLSPITVWAKYLVSLKSVMPAEAHDTPTPTQRLALTQRELRDTEAALDHAFRQGRRPAGMTISEFARAIFAEEEPEDIARLISELQAKLAAYWQDAPAADSTDADDESPL